MNEKKSFFEKLGKSLKLEDERYDKSPPEDEGAITAPEESQELETPTESEGEIAEENDGVFDAEGEIDPNTPTVTLAATTIKKATRSKIKKARSSNEAKKKKIAHSEEGQLTIDVFETEKEIVVKSTIAGVDSDELDINITPESVSIRGERQKDEIIRTEDYFYQECYWGTFSRSIILPTEIDPDKATASFTNGILTIRLPKISRSQNKKLKVKSH